MTPETLLANIARLSANYRDEILSHWLPLRDAYRTDWLEAFDFLLSHIFYQGRRDDLSTRYHERASSAIRDFFGNSPVVRSKRFNEAWSNGWLPHDRSWNGFAPQSSPICRLLREASAGKTRDQEMVVDSLRYVRGLQNWNIVNHSCEEVARGRICDHFAELDEIWQVGAKTASFYLRDLCTIYELDPGPTGWAVMQPIDTWVEQIALRLGLIQQGDEVGAVAEKIVSACRAAGVQPADFNAGAWYLGTHSLDIALASLGATN